MPSTISNVTEIKNAVSNYSREQVRDKLNELQRIVYASGAVQSEVMDNATGMPPYLETTQGQRHYVLGADVRQTISIFTDSAVRGYSPRRDVFARYAYRNANYIKIAIRTQDALPNSVATLTFVDDPGTTTTNYFHRYTKFPTEITSEVIQLDLPEHIHWIVRDGVIALLSKENYGDVGKRRELIRQICIEVANEMSKGAQGKSNKTPVQFDFLALDEDNWGYY